MQTISFASFTDLRPLITESFLDSPPETNLILSFLFKDMKI